MTVEIGTEDMQFPEREYVNGIFVAVFYLSNFIFFLSEWVTSFSFHFDDKSLGKSPRRCTMQVNKNINSI
jgi:hypothetical protein